MMRILLIHGAVKYEQVSDVVDLMLYSVDLNGPASFHDSVAPFWVTIIRLRAQFSPSLVHETSERIIRWWFVRWKPCKFDREFFAFCKTD